MLRPLTRATYTNVSEAPQQPIEQPTYRSKREMPSHTRLRTPAVPAVALVTLLVCTFVSSSPTNIGTDSLNQTDNDALNVTNNYNCPSDCKCVLASHTHVPFLHAKCSSLNGLKSMESLHATLPIHSIDLSYLNLPRLSHALEKLPDVTSIDLSHNELHEIGHLGRRIKKLNLKHNRITSSKLAKLPQHVQVLNLQHNDITYLPREFTKLSHLQTLELSHNQINCSCETLDVRNWLQAQHVFMEHAVICSYPLQVKGKPWLQVKQSDICEHEKQGRHFEEEDNELMMGDQPVEGSGDADDEDELGKAYMPIDDANTAKPADILHLEDIEGSGDLTEMNMPVNLAMTTTDPAFESSQEQITTDQPLDEDEEDGSGSGDGMLIVPAIARGPIITDDFEAPDTDDTDDAYDNKPVEQPAPEATPSPNIFGDGMGIFDDKDGAKSDKPIEEEVIVPVVHHNVDAENVPEVITDGPGNGDGESSAIMHAKVGEQEESNATYLLLGVIALIVVGLLLFVGIKRCKNNSNAGAHDVENARQTELLDMDNKHPGKPLQRNGNEHAPLIGEKSKSDMAKPINGAGKKPYDAADVKDGSTQQQPLLNGNGTNGSTAPNEPIEKVNAPITNEQPPHEYHPITPRYPTPKSPRASKYAQHPQGGESNNNNNDDSYLPSSPKSGRYSPVYSPETGRVKIKLTETPRPKTPMLVTRSKSNAGEFISTPVTQTGDANAAVPGVHAPTGVPIVNGH